MQLNNIRLSVIIPGFNTPEAWWRRCLDSVRRACGPNDEIICVDDGSSIEASFLDKFNDEDLRISVLHRNLSEGPSVARNDALNIAKGEYITFVDSDDEVKGRVYDECVGLMDNSKGDVAVFGCDVIWVDDGLKKTDIPKQFEPHQVNFDDVKLLYNQNLFNYVWNKVYRRDFLVRNRILFDPVAITGEDLMFNLLCCEKKAVWCSIPKSGYIYYRTRGTLLSSYKKSLIPSFNAINEAWVAYVKSESCNANFLSEIPKIDNKTLVFMEWRNIWMPRTPCSIGERRRWLKAHPEIGGSFEFIRMFIFMILRKWLYIRPIRRRHIKSLYPNAYDI